MYHSTERWSPETQSATRSNVRFSLSSHLQSSNCPPCVAFCQLLLDLSTITMDTVNGAMELLRQAITKGKKVKGLAERVDSLTATLRLLVPTFGQNSQKVSLRIFAHRTLPSPLIHKFLENSSRRSENRSFRCTRNSRSRPSNSPRRSFHSCSKKSSLCI